MQPGSLLQETSGHSKRDDRNGVAFDDGRVIAACVVCAVGGHRAHLFSWRDLAEQVGQHWELELDNFIQVCPKEMLDKLAHPLGKLVKAIPAE